MKGNKRTVGVKKVSGSAWLSVSVCGGKNNRYVLALVAGRYYIYIPVVKCLSVLEKGRTKFMKKFSELLIFFLFIYLFRERKREMTIERGYRLYSSCLFLGMGGSVDDSFSGRSN
jgi:hypothetical protein